MLKKERACLLFILVIASSLRLYNLNKYDLWYDELITTKFSYQRVRADSHAYNIPRSSIFLNKLKVDPNAPFYFILVHGYSFLFGSGKSLRILSLLLSVLTLWVFYRVARLFLRQTESLLSVALMAASPVHIWYAQEARGYSLECLMAIIMIFVWIEGFRHHKDRYWIVLCITSLVAVFTTYFSIFLLVALGVICIFKDYRVHLKKWLFTIVGMALVSSLYLKFTDTRINETIKNLWISSLPQGSFWQTFGVFALGYSANPPLLTAGIVFSLCLFISGAYFYYRKNKTNAIFLVTATLLPLTITSILSWIISPFYLTRKMLIVSPFFYILLTKGLWGINKKIYRIAGITILTIMIALSLMNYYKNYIIELPDGKDFYPGVHARKNYSRLLNNIKINLKEKDIIIGTDVQSFLSLLYYFGFPSDATELVHFYFFPEFMYKFQRQSFIDMAKTNPATSFEGLASSSQTQDKTNSLHALYYPKNSPHATVKEIKLDTLDYKRVWLVSSTWNKYGLYEPNSKAVREFVSLFFRRKLIKKSDTFTLELYEKDFNASSSDRGEEITRK